MYSCFLPPSTSTSHVLGVRSGQAYPSGKEQLAPGPAINDYRLEINQGRRDQMANVPGGQVSRPVLTEEWGSGGCFRFAHQFITVLFAGFYSILECLV